ncbi:hypothetical protein ACFQS1_27165 [Paractinoplanes rhizophilus]|uniref:Uncharacterized protein n=1 Tax=Paractinoplanes rhizophilus TaxID=1416877 RepID=A0ABW2HX66_9ACTN
MSSRNRFLMLFAVALTIAGVAVGVSGSAVAAPRAATPAVAADHVLTVLGAGPYRIGTSLSRLTEAGLIDWVTGPDAAGAQLAGSAGSWSGELMLTFHHGFLVVVETATGSVRTAAGARVGMSFAEVEAIYHGYGKLITNDQGNTAYLVPVGPMALLFGDHPIRPGVGSIQAGPAWILRPAFRNG